MPADHVALTTARRRIRAAYDPALFAEVGNQLAKLLSDHMAHVQASDSAVLNWNEAEENIAYAEAMLTEGEAPHTKTLSERFARLVRAMLDRGHNLHDPRYIGHQVPAPVPIAGWFDAVGSVTNQVMAIYEMGPFASSVEQAMVRRLGERIGWQADTFAGMVTHGGSLANLTALLTARNVALGDVWENGMAGGRTSKETPVLVVHAESHYSVVRTAGILGLGTRQIVRAELDDFGRIDPVRLDETLGRLRAENRPIVAVVACACATPIGAFDPLVPIADVCRRHRVWLHVPQCNIVVFRHVPDQLRGAPPEQLGAFQLELRREIIQSGEFYIVPTQRDGIGALRTVIINPLTTPKHLDMLMETLREKGRMLLRL